MGYGAPVSAQYVGYLCVTVSSLSGVPTKDVPHESDFTNSGTTFYLLDGVTA
jgi:hypothetical protein